jgi:hypothetical protein
VKRCGFGEISFVVRSGDACELFIGLKRIDHSAMKMDGTLFNRHSRAGGNPVTFVQQRQRIFRRKKPETLAVVTQRTTLDSRLRGNDGK